MKTAQQCLMDEHIALLLLGGALTTAEVMDHIYPGAGPNQRQTIRLSLTLEALLSAHSVGLVKRIEENRLHKWAAVETPETQQRSD